MRPIGFLRNEKGATRSKGSQVAGFISSADATGICKKGELIIPCNFTHAAIVGETGCGKTTSMIYPNLLDRMKRGHGIFVFDYKGCEEAAVMALAKRADRLKDAVVIGTFLGERINLIKDISARDFENAAGSLMKTRDSFWQEYGANLTLSIFNLLKMPMRSKKHKARGYDSVLDFSDKYPFNIKTIRDLTQEFLKFNEFMDDVRKKFKIKFFRDERSRKRNSPKTQTTKRSQG